MNTGLIVTVTPKDETRHARAVFTWSEDLDDCSVVAFGFDDDEMDALLEAKAHEGVTLEDYRVDLS